MKQEKVWTANNDCLSAYWVEDWGDLIDCLMSERKIENEQDLIGEEYFEGDVVPIPLRTLIPITTIIDVLNEKALEIAGEYADDWPKLTPEDMKELEDLIVSFLEKKHVRKFYDIENIVKKTITKEDIKP
jgi:hypothetical protein